MTLTCGACRGGQFKPGAGNYVAIVGHDIGYECAACGHITKASLTAGDTVSFVYEPTQ